MLRVRKKLVAVEEVASYLLYIHDNGIKIWISSVTQVLDDGYTSGVPSEQARQAVHDQLKQAVHDQLKLKNLYKSMQATVL